MDLVLNVGLLAVLVVFVRVYPREPLWVGWGGWKPLKRKNNQHIYLFFL